MESTRGSLRRRVQGDIGLPCAPQVRIARAFRSNVTRGRRFWFRSRACASPKWVPRNGLWAEAGEFLHCEYRLSCADRWVGTRLLSASARRTDGKPAVINLSPSIRKEVLE